MPARRIALAWFWGLFGVDQIERLQPRPQSALPQRCPDAMGVTVHPSASRSCRAFSTSFLGRRARGRLPVYNCCWGLSTARHDGRFALADGDRFPEPARRAVTCGLATSDRRRALMHQQ